jgi:hypothetical protein
MVVAHADFVLPEAAAPRVETVMQRNGEDHLVTIAGVIVPSDWDRQGNVTGVSISAFDEEEYFVQGQGKGGELIQHVRKDAEVVGWVEVERGKKKITVKHYRLRQHLTGDVK